MFICRTTTNITLDDDVQTIEACENPEEVLDVDESSYFQTMKRRRSSSNSEQMKLIETVTKCIKDNNAKKFEMFQQAIKPQNELELYFASVCKTVEKFQPMVKAKIKMEINQLISRYELDHFSSVIYSVNTENSNELIVESYGDNFVEDFLVEQ